MPRSDIHSMNINKNYVCRYPPKMETTLIGMFDFLN